MQVIQELSAPLTKILSTEPIPFSPPFVDEDVIAEVVDTLKSGWITTGPKVKLLEEACALLSGCTHCLCVNSWTSAAQLVLKWWGVGPGDEVIIPAYTYAATALAVIHAGAKPVMVDIGTDFTIDAEKVRKAITSKTKAIIPVDIGGWPCDYEALHSVVNDPNVRTLFSPSNNNQQQLRRLLVIADAAHSIGARYNDEPLAKQADITIYSFHAVKNVTTAEGGAICLNLPTPFDQETVYRWMKLNSMNGQTKDAFSKSQAGGWSYDIVSDGLKINMPDILAAIGLAQIKRYESYLLPERRRIFQLYSSLLSEYSWAELPPCKDKKRASSCHLFPLRIDGITENQRNRLIDLIAASNVAVNVHFKPLPLLTYFRESGYDIADYPSSYDQYSRVITLPIYPQLTNDHVQRVVDCVVTAYNEVRFS